MCSRLTTAMLTLAAFVFFCGIASLTVGMTYANGGCVATYTVQRGDTLTSIAQRHNVSLAELIRLNRGRIWNPNLIYTGQVLCLPVPVTNSRVVVEVRYQYEPDDDERRVVLATRGGYIGKRVTYPLQPVDAIDTVSTTNEVALAITGEPPPVLLGIRNSEDATTYTLVAVGQDAILSSLRISEREPVTITLGCVSTPVAEALGGPTVKDVQVTLVLEGQDGLRYPLDVTALNLMPTKENASTCYADKLVAFALFPATPAHTGKYRILMVLTEEGFGPPGRGWYARCVTWSRYRGWLYRWVGAWYGCR